MEALGVMRCAAIDCYFYWLIILRERINAVRETNSTPEDTKDVVEEAGEMEQLEGGAPEDMMVPASDDIATD